MKQPGQAKRFSRRWFLLVLLLARPLAAHAHIGSKDIFEEVSAGPYKLYVTIRPPDVIPGVATVDVRTSGAAVAAVDLTPVPMVGEGSTHPPAADKMKVSSVDTAFFTGSVWIMQSGSWQVRFDVTGAAGQHLVSVPVPASSLVMAKMKPGFALLLAALGLLLVCGMAGIVAAAFSQSQLEPGNSPDASLRKRARLAMACSLAFMALVLWSGARWWHLEALVFSGDLYHPPVTRSTLHDGILDMHVTGSSPESGLAFKNRSNADFILDHGQPMHLYVVREPELDQVYHLHPKFTRAGEFELTLPTMLPGHYKLYGDVVHASGFPETLVSSIDVPAAMRGVPLSELDAAGSPAPLSAGELGSTYKLPDGYTMVWQKPAPLTASTAYAFQFSLLDPAGKPPAHMRPYLGMAGHAAFLKTDGTVFAHVHPEGSAAMAAVMLANDGGATLALSAPASMSTDMPGMAGMMMPADADLDSNTVEFPYGFPTPGRYRIFIQMKHDGVVETGTFDALVK